MFGVGSSSNQTTKGVTYHKLLFFRNLIDRALCFPQMTIFFQSHPPPTTKLTLQLIEYVALVESYSTFGNFRPLIFEHLILHAM
jgi:hypothetical protein